MHSLRMSLSVTLKGGPLFRSGEIGLWSENLGESTTCIWCMYDLTPTFRADRSWRDLVGNHMRFKAFIHFATIATNDLAE